MKTYIVGLACLFYIKTNAQVSGIKTIGTDYPTLASAINVLNTQGVGSGGLILNIPAGYMETAPNGGFVLGSSTLNASLSVSSQLIIQKSAGSSGANPILTAFRGTNSNTDGIFIIAGSDYVTINSIDLQEASSNIGSNLHDMEWGYAILKLNAADGSQHIAIKNCTINLDNSYLNSTGIFSGNYIPASTTTLTISNTSGINSDIKVNGCSIANCFHSINIAGYSGSSTYYDTDLQIGTETGNVLSNVNGNAGNLYSVNVSGVHNVDIENNSISFTGSSAGTAYAISISNLCDGNIKVDNNTFSASLNNSSQFSLINIQAVASALEVLNNTMQNNLFNTAGNGLFYAIFQSGENSSATINISGNSISNCSYNANATSGTSNFYGIYKGPGSAVAVTINNNIISGNILNQKSSGDFAGIYMNGSNETANNNQIYGNSISGPGTTSTIFGVYSNNGNVINQNNQVYNNSNKASLTGSVYGIYNTSATGTENYSGNNIYNLSSSGNGIVSGLYTKGNSTSRIVSANMIWSLSSQGGPVSAISQNNSNGSIFKNKIFDLSSQGNSGAVTAISIAGGSSTIYNNLIGNLSAPSANGLNAVNGINISGGSTMNIYYNTIYINTSSSASTFGSSALYVSNNSVNLILKDNILINSSTPGASGGYTAAFRYENQPGTNYSASSNYNLFFAGTASPVNLLYGESSNASAVNGQETLSGLRTYLLGRDQFSITESPSFISTSGMDGTFLHPVTTNPTQVESGGNPVAGISDDFDGNSRNASTPDIGAVEFNGIQQTLPVRLVSFTGEWTSDGIRLKWVTSNEMMTEGFAIERSDDGINFQTIQFVNSLAPGGNSSQLLNYSYTDKYSIEKKLFYRVKEIDLNQGYYYSDILVISPDLEVLDFKISPNPVRSNTSIEFYAPDNGISSISFLDISGNEILKRQIIAVKKGVNNVSVDFQLLNSGIYYIKISSVDHGYNGIKRFIKLQH